MLNKDIKPLFWAIQSSELPQLTSILIIKTFSKQSLTVIKKKCKCAIQRFKQT